MRSRTVRMVIPAAVLAAAALTLTGCQSKTTAASATTTPTTAAATTPADTPSTGPGTGTTAMPSDSPTATAAPETTPASAPVHHAAGVPAGCASSQLSVALADPNAGAGQYYAKIVFTNTSHSSCTLLGYPGVSYVRNAGIQAGTAATRTGQGYRAVVLSPGGHATATIHDADGMGGYSKGQCDLTSVKGLRIYPPNQRAALYLPHATSHCAGTGIHPLSVGPVVS